MSLNDPLANTLSAIRNRESIGKTECTVKSSKMTKIVLAMMKEKGYIGDYSEVEDGRGNVIVVNLLGKINKCGAIKPRYPVKLEQIEKFEKRYLLAKDFGILILSTSDGVMTHIEAKEKKLGGRLISYCY